MKVYIKMENEIPHVINRVTVYTENEIWTTTSKYANDIYIYVLNKLGRGKDGRTYRSGWLVATDFEEAKKLALYALEILIRAEWAGYKTDWYNIDDYQLSDYNKYRNRQILAQTAESEI